MRLSVLTAGAILLDPLMVPGLFVLATVLTVAEPRLAPVDEYRSRLSPGLTVMQLGSLQNHEPMMTLLLLGETWATGKKIP